MAYGTLALDAISTSGDLAITGNVITTGNLTTSRGTVTSLVSGTAQATTSGTYKDFTDIPSWVKRITVVIKGISGSGTSMMLVRVGTASGFVATGYLSSGTSIGSAVTTAQYTTGLGLGSSVIAASTFSGIMTLVNISGTTWVGSFSGAYHDAAYTAVGGGYVDAGGVLTSIRITTVNGTDTFDAGSVNILYE